MENGRRKPRRQLSPEEKWEIFLEITSQEISQADAARKWGVDVSVIVRLRALAKDAALAAFASAKPGRVPSPEQVELEAALLENDRLSEALKEMAVELTLFRGRQTSCVNPGIENCGGGGCGVPRADGVRMWTGGHVPRDPPGDPLTQMARLRKRRG